MLIALGVFGVVMLIILGAYFLLVVRDEQKLLERLAPQNVGKRGRRMGVIKAEDRLSNVAAIDRMLRRSDKFITPLKTFVEQSGVRFTIGSYLLAIGCFGLLGFLVTFRYTFNIWVSLFAGLIGGLLPYLYVKRARNKRLFKFEEQFPEAIDLVARALRAGHSLPTGLSMVADELVAPVGTEFRTLYDEQNYGLTLPEALRNFAKRIPVLDARFFVTAVLTQREAGGNLAEVLDNLAEVIRARFKVKRQVRVISAHGRITGWVLAGLPPSVALASFIISPIHMQTLLGDPLGVNMIMAAAVMQVLGTLVIRKIVDIEVLTMPIGLLITVFAVFGAVALGVGGLMQFVMTQTNFERRRLQQARVATATGVLLENPSLDPEPSKIAKRLGSIVPKSPKEMGRLRKKFARAGYHSTTPIAIYSLGQLVLPAIFAFIPLVFLPMSQAWMMMLISALLGYLIPGFIVSRITTKRQKVITNGLPDLLDLLIVCLEAGSSLDQAIVKATDELELAYPALAEEFRMLITETRAGKPRLEAFKNLAARTGVDDVRALVSMLVQTDRFGTSVSQALRTHAEVSRTKRRQRAEERAAKIGVKLVFPLVFLLFPAFFTVTLGPAVVRFVRVLFGEVGVQ